MVWGFSANFIVRARHQQKKLEQNEIDIFVSILWLYYVLVLIVPNESI